MRAIWIVTLLLGFGFPPDRGLVHAYLAPLFEGLAEAEVDYGSLLWLALVSIAVGLTGFVVAFLMYSRRRVAGFGLPAAESIAAAARPAYSALLNKYWLDDLYDIRAVGAIKAAFGAAWAFDIHIIDELANRLGLGFQRGGRALRLLQTGVVGNYALTIVVGLLFVGATFAYLTVRR